MMIKALVMGTDQTAAGLETYTARVTDTGSTVFFWQNTQTLEAIGQTTGLKAEITPTGLKITGMTLYHSRRVRLEFEATKPDAFRLMLRDAATNGIVLERAGNFEDVLFAGAAWPKA